MLKRLNNNKPRRDALLIVLIGISIWMWSRNLDLFELLVEYVEQHEAWDLDELIILALVVGIMSTLYAFLRVRDLRREVLKRNEAEQNVRWIAQHDYLTRLPNRRGLSIELKRLKSNNTLSCPHIAYSIDLDGFKKVNDLLGHAAGDQALVDVAARLRGIFASSLIFRLGGDEFVVLQDCKSQVDAEQTGQKIVRALSSPYMFAGKVFELGASVGIAQFPRDGRELESVIQCADTAMYE